MTPIVGLVLYGSRARGDHEKTSDVDLLALATGGAAAVVTRHGVTVSRYPLDHVLRRARSGDLFAFHVVSEGKVIYEQEPVFARMKRAFCYRSDYSREIQIASDVGWFLVHHRDRAVHGLSFNQRIAWCTHTMIVAKAATERLPVFSAAGLAAFAGSSAVASLIQNKRSPAVDPAVLDVFRGVLEEFGTPEPRGLATLAAERRRFDVDKNPAGAGALRAMM
jgi:hypothetical protein